MARTKKTKVYLAGPMTGYDNYNFDAFNAAAAELRDMGFFVVNPAEYEGGDQTRAWEEYLAYDLDQVRKMDAVVLLDGWQDTAATGARLEIQYALAHSIPVVEYYDVLDYGTIEGIGTIVDDYGYESVRDFVKALNNGETFGWIDSRIEPMPRESALIKAEGLVNGDRQAAYDHPTENFGRIVRLWNALLADKLTSDITNEEHAMMMMLVKMARLQHSPDHEDSVVDIAGYAGTYDLMIQRRKEETARNEGIEAFLNAIFATAQMYEEEEALV